MMASSDCWALLVRATANGGDGGLEAIDAMAQLLRSRLPAAAFTTDRTAALCALVNNGLSGPQAILLATRLLARAALLRDGDREAPWLRTAAEASIRLLQAASGHQGYMGAAVHCAGACSHGLPATEAAQLAKACLDARGAASSFLPAADLEAASGLLHLAVASSRAGPTSHVLISSALRTVLRLYRCLPGGAQGPVQAPTWEMPSKDEPRLLELTVLAQRAGEALLVEVPSPGLYLEPREASQGVETPAPSAMSPKPEGAEAWGSAAGACISEAEESSGGVISIAVPAIAGGLLRAWQGRAPRGAPHLPRNVRALEKTLEVAAETAWGGRGDVDRFLRAAVACAAAPPWRTTGPPPRPCLNVTRCLLAALLEERHDLTPLFHLPARGISPEAGALWLAARRGSGSVGLVPSAHSLLAAVLGQICGLVLADTAMEAMSIVQDSLASWAIGQHLGFCRYVETSPPEWLDEAGSVAVGLCGAAGDSFIAAVAILAEIQKQPHLLQAAKVIETLSCLDFARVPLSAHGPLAAAAISMVSSDPAMLAELLSHIVDASAALVPQGTPADPVRASRALQLMRAAAAAMGPSSCPCWTPRRVADAVIPVAGAHLRHGAEPLRAAAHALFCRLLQRSSGDSRVSEAVASFYIGRTVAAFPWLATPEQLAASAGSVITALPANSLLQAMLPAHLIARAAELSSRAREGGAPAAGAGGTIKADGRPVEQLAQLSSECMLNASAQVQPAVMRELREAVVVAPVKVQQVFLPILRRSIQESDNWIFKVTWVRWYQRLVADCRAGGAFELVML